jgi:hypothetical protein
VLCSGQPLGLIHDRKQLGQGGAGQPLGLIHDRKQLLQGGGDRLRMLNIEADFSQSTRVWEELEPGWPIV